MAETTITSALPRMISSDSRTNGNGGTSLTISAIDRLTASLHSSARARSGSPVAMTAALRAGLPSLVSRPIQSRRPASAGSRGRRRKTSGRSARKSIVNTRPGNRFVPRHFEYRLIHSNVSRAYLRDRRQADSTGSYLG